MSRRHHINVLWCDDERTYFNSFCQPQRFGKNFIQHHFPEFEHSLKVAFASGLREVEERYLRKNGFDFDLVISDVNFGEGLMVTDRQDEGVQILETLKQRYPELDVILVTQYSNALSVQTYIRAKKAGMVEWLEKSPQGGIPEVCRGPGKHNRQGAETICGICGEPFDPFWYELKKLLAPRLKYLTQMKKLEDLYKRKICAEIIWESAAIEQIVNTILKVAPADATVMIRGESGVGKELFAKAIHDISQRKGPFITVNCAALPEALIESELFGYAPRSGIAGAELHGKPGKFELADRGTIFLDEVADLRLEAQAKLLRVTEEKCVSRLSATTTIAVDVRIVCATNKNLEQEMAAGRFRGDLFYRLNQYPLFIPPLRNRKEDVIPLIEHFIATANQATTVKLSADALEFLKSYDWPGNVRELATFVKRLVIDYHDPEPVSANAAKKILHSFAAQAPSNSSTEKTGAAWGLMQRLNIALTMMHIAEEQVSRLEKHLQGKGVITREHVMEIMNWPRDRNHWGKAERLLLALDEARITTLMGKKHIVNS